jgi:hypothetical protein
MLCFFNLMNSNCLFYRASLIFKSKDPDNDRSYVRKVKAWREVQVTFMPQVIE